jgi:adenylate cyclase
MNRRRWTLLAAAHAVLLGAAVAAHRGIFAAVDDLWRDALFRLRGEAPAKSRVVIAAIDDKSMSELGRWPWSRKLSAQLIGRLSALDAKAIALDIFYLDPSDAAADQALIEATRKAGNVVHLRPPSLSGPEELKDPLQGLTEASASMATAKIGSMSGAAVRCLSAQASDSRRTPTTAIAAVALFRGRNPDNFKAALPERLCLNFRGTDSFLWISAADILKDRLSAAQKMALSGAIVFVGFKSAIQDFDGRATPFNPKAPGVEFHATLADNLLQGNDLRGARRPIKLALLYLGAIGVAALFLSSRRTGALGGPLVLAAWAAACYAAFSFNVVLPGPAVGAAIALSYLACLAVPE